MKIYKKYKHLPINIAMQKTQEEMKKRKTKKTLKQLEEELLKTVPKNGKTQIITLVISNNGGLELHEIHNEIDEL